MTLLLVTLFLKSLLVFAAAGLLLLALRRSSAAARHLVCLLTLGAVLLLPLCSLSLPVWHLPVLTQLKPEAEPTPRQEPTPVRPSPALPKGEGKEFAPANSRGPRPALAAAARSSSSLLGRTPAKQGGGFLFFYLSGLLLASVRPLLGLWGINRLSRACVAAADEPMLTTAAACASLLGLRTPRLCRADVPVPMTWGWRRPVVVLPLASADWPEDRLCSVLLHEMAHIKRRDWPGHRFADFACAVYWFHPLVWLTSRRLRAESEVACDDLVLASGIPAPDYARHLLAIAQTLPPIARSPHSAIAMAQTSKIERRLTMLLDPTQSRRTLTRRFLLAVLVPSAAALVGLAVLRPSVKAQTVPNPVEMPQTASSLTSGVLHTTATTLQMMQDANGKKLYTFSPDLKIDGTTLFAGMADADKPGSPWWSPTGALLAAPVYDTQAAPSHFHGVAGTRTVSFAFRLPADALGVTMNYKLPDTSSSSSAGTWRGKTSDDVEKTEAQIFASTGGTRVVTAALPPSQQETSLQLGIAAGPWKTVVTDNNLTGTSGFGNQEAFLFSAVAVTKDGLTLSISNNTTDDIRVVAVTAQGRTILPDEIGDNSVGALDQINARFNDLLLSQIKEIRVQTRPFQWIEFKDVALKPVQ